MAQADAQTKCDVVVRSEITIDRPAREVWSHFLRMEDWMSGLQFQNIRGERGEEGEVRLVTPLPGSPYRSYFTRAVRVTPHRQYVVKVVPVEGSDYLGFADFSFTEAAGKTHLVYDIYLELSVTHMDEQQLAILRCTQQQEIFQEVSRNNENLKSLVETRQEAVSVDS